MNTIPVQKPPAFSPARWAALSVRGKRDVWRGYWAKLKPVTRHMLLLKYGAA